MLYQASLVYGRNLSADELIALADIFAEHLAGEKPEDIVAAFKEHTRSCKQFPTPAHILEIMPGCRSDSSVTVKPKSFEEMFAANRDVTPGYGQEICKRWRLREACDPHKLLEEMKEQARAADNLPQ